MLEVFYSTLRELTKTNLRRRVSIFASSVGNVPVNAITPEIIERYLAGRKVAPVSRNGDNRALSRFTAEVLGPSFHDAMRQLTGQ